MLFWKKQGFFPKKSRVFLFAEPLKSLEKRGKNTQKSKGERGGKEKKIHMDREREKKKEKRKKRERERGKKNKKKKREK